MPVFFVPVLRIIVWTLGSCFLKCGYHSGFDMYKKRRHLERLYICLVDLAIIVISLFVAGLIRHKSFAAYSKAENITEMLWLFATIHIALYFVLNIYSGIFRRNKYQELLLCLGYTMALIGCAMLVTFGVKIRLFKSRLVFGYFIVCTSFLMAFFHSLYRNRARLPFLGKKNARNILLIAETDKVPVLINKLAVSKEFTWNIVAIVLTDDKDTVALQPYNTPILKVNTDEFYEFCTQNAIDEVMVSSNLLLGDQQLLSKLILFFEQMGVVTDVCLDTMEPKIKGARQVYNLEGYPVIAYSSRLYDYRMLVLKRTIDIIGGFVGLIITGIISIFLVPAILIDSPGPIFFTQDRVGMNGRVFKIFKFRSMYKDAEQRKKELEEQNEMNGLMFKMENDPRITKVGKFIRKTSLDEFPQFWNVLKGDMSLVGTRPPTVDEYMQYNAYQKRRISFRPGITGLWQVSGRSNIKDFDEVVRLDLKYIDEWSLMLDIKILFKTVWIVLHGSGAE